jgi:hypothetical protein
MKNDKANTESKAKDGKGNDDSQSSPVRRTSAKRRHSRTPPMTKGEVITLWTLTKKYDVALKEHEVVGIKESEVDREEVADVYRFLETPWERVLDGRFYLNLAQMQHRRDAHFATSSITPEEWIYQFALEVKRRASPLVFLVSKEATTPHLDLPKEDTPLKSDDAPTQDDRTALSKHKVEFKQLAIDKLETRRSQLVSRLQGKRFTLQELSAQLTNWELDLLSQMIRDESIPAAFVGKNTIIFRPAKIKEKEDVLYAAAAIEVEKHEGVQT